MVGLVLSASVALVALAYAFEQSFLGSAFIGSPQEQFRDSLHHYQFTSWAAFALSLLCDVVFVVLLASSRRDRKPPAVRQ
jgi:hypothetical protein